MSGTTMSVLPTGRLEFSAETLERFAQSWRPRAAIALGGPIELTLDCASVNCGESDDCDTVRICSAMDCTGCFNSCSCAM